MGSNTYTSVSVAKQEVGTHDPTGNYAMGQVPVTNGTWRINWVAAISLDISGVSYQSEGREFFYCEKAGAQVCRNPISASLVTG
jgi:hypothetical protein